MRLNIADYVRKLASDIEALQEGDSPYINIPYYQQRVDPSDPSWMIEMGPPSLYNDYDRKDRLKNKEDIRRQGPYPPLPDRLHKKVMPVTVTNIGDPKEDAHGEVRDNTLPGARNENRDTIGFNPGELNVNPFRDG